ncbi:MAG: S41 family peptidase [Gemmataceae bacterium]
MKSAALSLLAAALMLGAQPGRAEQTIRLANHPALSPDGKTLAFDWDGDIWSVPTAGGLARRLTNHPARDREPRFAPDGKQIAFISERSGSPQVHIMAAGGGTPRQLTFHTTGCTLQEWCPDGRRLLINANRDHFWRHPERFFTINIENRQAERLLFDDYGQNGSLSPDGKRLLMTREGPAWWRKGYRGSQASQIWLYDLDGKTFRQILAEETGCLWPLWRPDGKGFYYVSARGGSFNLWERDLDSNAGKQLTHFTDDSVAFPCLSRDGSTLVFRHLFDLYCYHPGKEETPCKIDLRHDSDPIEERVERRVLKQASEAAFTADGLEIAFIAGGDLWVMDTELREPRQVTATAEEEKHPIFSPDGRSLLFVADRDARSDIYRAVPGKRGDNNRYWWQHGPLTIERLTEDGEVKSNLKFSPDGSRLAYLRARGDLWVAKSDGREARKIVPSWSELEYDWSPDGKWLVYAHSDNDFNRDIWIIPADGSGKPFNLSRHPYNDGDPVWSPDGRLIAFTGRRGLTEVDIHYVWLRAEDDEKSSRERALEKALEKINKVRNKPRGAAEPPATAPPTSPKVGGGPEVVIDFEQIHRRIHRITIPHTTESGLFWSPDARKLAFTAVVEGKRGTYTVDIPDDLKPKLLTTQTGTQPRWLKQGNQIVWLSSGLPASFTPGAAKPTTPASPPVAGADTGTSGYRFQALQRVDLSQRNRAAFDLCWRTMRDSWYDERLGNRDWPAIRRKYTDMAAEAPDSEAFTTVVQLMLGELNGSHLGFFPPGTRAYARFMQPPNPTTPNTAGTELGSKWSETTAHLGVRFRPDFEGPGLKIRDVLPGGPASKKMSRLREDEVILKIDDIAVDPDMDLTRVLNGPLPRDVRLRVRGADGKERDVTLRPINYEQAQPLLYQAWMDGNRKLVERISKGAFGYLHIRAMDALSFSKFEAQLYAVGAGKDGLLIDVRENGGGSTADHLLTALTQPVHAITVQRGGEPGYPHDRKIYATWNKPIVVLCNQNSFSNAEIFSHAIKTLKRGQLVGVPTAGGVISTGAERIMDVGVLRVPSRGWFLIDSGLDMELNGAVPDHILWPKPGQLPRGEDVQLTKAIEVLQTDVRAWKQRPRPSLRKSSERLRNETPSK